MRASETDGRQRQTAVSSAGRAALQHAHDWHEQVFAQLTEGWSDRQRRDLQRAMTDLIDRSYLLGPW